MTIQHLEIPLPQAPHPDTLKEAALTIMSADKSRLICYCPRNHCGAVLAIKQGLWAIYSPLSFKEFYNTLGQRGVNLPKGKDRETWLQTMALATQSDIPRLQ